jgi:SAM-dependent methyltransferase
MSALAERLKQKYFGRDEHPYTTLEREIERHLGPEVVLLDAGCGRGAPVLSKFAGRARRLIGVDVVEFLPGLAGLELVRGDLARTGLPDASVDLVYSRSVMEHVADPARVYAEMQRILRPGGRFVFLTANLWDYASIIAWIVPNRLHPWIVSKVEGRAEEDVFPIQYRTNTRAAVEHWAAGSGFEVESFRHLGQYPAYFQFNGFLFWLATGYEKLISRYRCLHWLRGWIFVVLRKP